MEEPGEESLEIETVTMKNRKENTIMKGNTGMETERKCGKS